MSRLEWGSAGTRYYETGVDRGVLYVDNIGVAWSGLISISESPSGGEARPYYIDGYKYLNLATAEEFEATIEAYSAPAEFGVCDGVTSLQNGLFATQQPRKPFGLSYRTRIGNDSDGSDHGYKIHLVYNALAAPAERTNTTEGDTAEPAIFSWEISTRPPMTSGIKPTAHFIIDSRFTVEAKLAEIEDILYGTEVLTADLPTPSELMLIFAS